MKPWTHWDARKDVPPDDAVVTPIRPLKARPIDLPKLCDIPPRPWLYGRHLMRGMITVMIAPGGVGKTQLAMGMAICMATGRPLLGQKIWQRVNSWIFNLEDPIDELNRRIGAMRSYHRLLDAELEGRMFVNSGRDRPLCVARISDHDRTAVIFPDEDALVAEGVSNNIGMIAVDPYIRSHELDENSNTLQAQAAAAWARVAERMNAGVALVHHTRKGKAEDVDSARGAKALTDHSRATLLVSAMTPEEAEKFGKTEEERFRYFRVDDAKANMAPRGLDAEWYEMHPEELGNRSLVYPKGDTVMAIAPWKPRTLWADIPPDWVKSCVDQIERGYDGVPYTQYKRGKDHGRWVCDPVMQIMGVTEAQAVEIVADWIKAKFLVQTEFRVDGKTRTGLRVDRDVMP